MATLQPVPHRCHPCGEEFASLAAAIRHVDRMHGHGRIESLISGRTTAEGSPAGTHPGNGGGRTPETHDTEGAVPADDRPADWHAAQRAAWIAGCLDQLTQRWPTELDDEIRLEFEEYFDELDYEASKVLVARAIEVLEVFPTVAQLRRLQNRSRASVNADGIDQARQALDEAKGTGTS